MLVFKNAFLIDGTGNEPVEGATVIIENEKITEAGKGVDVPKNACVLDLKGKTIVPGFSDAHSHIGGCDNFDRPGLSGRFDSYDYIENMAKAMTWGVTTVRSAGDFTPEILAYRNEVNEGKIRSPRIIASGRMVQANGGHPAFTVFFSDQKVIDNACVLVDDTTDIETEIKKMIDSGVDWIKTFLSDDDKMNYPESAPRLSNQQLRKIADVAHKYGKPLMVHVDDIGDLVEAVDIGADSIEHTINTGTSDHELTDETLKLLTSKDVWVVPTMIATLRHDGGFEHVPRVYAELEKAVGKMITAGVKLGVGCDSGIPFVPYGECVHLEMELLTKAGMSPLAAITAATGGNAKMFRKADEFGTIEAGKSADLVVLKDNPIEDIINTRSIKMVVNKGKVVLDNILSE